MMIRDTLLRIIGAEPRRTVIDYVVPGTGYFFAGLVVGGVTALLLAPKSGREMRHDLKENADHLRKQIEQRAENMVDKAKGLLPGVTTAHDDTWEADKAARVRRNTTNPS
jgi:gas vesicle protein